MDNPEKTERGNPEKTETGNQEWTIQRHWKHGVHKTKTNKRKNTTQKTKKMSNTDPKKLWVKE